MTSVFTSAWYTARIAAIQTQIENYEAAIAAISTQGVQSYTLDTGQDRQVVTHADIASLNRTVQSLYNQLETLEARRDGTGVYVDSPAW